MYLFYLSNFYATYLKFLLDIFKKISFFESLIFLKFYLNAQKRHLSN